MKILNKIFDKFKGKKILVIGDIMLDKYVWGEVSRISPEAPIQIVDVKKETYVEGGAGNAAKNISFLGGKAFLIGTIGNDNYGKILMTHLKNSRIETKGVIIHNKKTIVKERVLAFNQQLLRIDHEDKEDIDYNTENKIFNHVKKLIRNIDAVIISDYAKGLITKNLSKEIIELCNKNNKIIIIDPRPQHTSYYKNATFVTPNHHEASTMTKIDLIDESDNNRLKLIGTRLLQELNSNILITRGKYGMSLFEKNGTITNLPTVAKEVVDVSGAGDTAIATFTLALVSGADLKEAMDIANHASGIVITKVGTATTNINEIKRSLENHES